MNMIIKIIFFYFLYYSQFYFVLMLAEFLLTLYPIIVTNIINFIFVINTNHHEPYPKENKYEILN